jgi:hypothetical protein
MANPTTNYGFVLPTPTDLVTDLPADFDVALQGVDTRLKALQPGTTLGDLAYSSATANTNTRLGIGTTGQVLTVAAGVPSWASPGGGAVGCALYNTTNQTIAQATVTTVTFDSEVFDTDAFHSTATNTGRITIPTGKGGKYLFNLRVQYINSAATSSVRQMYLNKNGSTDITNCTFVAQNTTEIQLQMVTLTTAVPGDYFTLNTWQNSGGSTTLYNGIAQTEFSCQYIGA